MTTLEWFEPASYVMTIVGLPMAILVLVWEQRRARQNDADEGFTAPIGKVTEAEAAKSRSLSL